MIGINDSEIQANDCPMLAGDLVQRFVHLRIVKASLLPQSLVTAFCQLKELRHFEAINTYIGKEGVMPVPESLSMLVCSGISAPCKATFLSTNAKLQCVELTRLCNLIII